MSSFPEGADPNCQGVSEFIYEDEQHTPCIVIVSVQNLGQGTLFALGVLQAVFLSLACFVFQNKGFPL